MRIMAERKKASRWKVIRCRTCGKVIQKFDKEKYHGDVPADLIFRAIRQHYKKHHPGKFKESIRKGVQSRKK